MIVVHDHDYHLYCALPDRLVYFSKADESLSPMWRHRSDRCVLYSLWRDGHFTLDFQPSLEMQLAESVFLHVVERIRTDRHKRKMRKKR